MLNWMEKKPIKGRADFIAHQVVDAGTGTQMMLVQQVNIILRKCQIGMVTQKLR